MNVTDIQMDTEADRQTDRHVPWHRQHYA